MVDAREMNLSQFVFLDTNRNGIFELGEQAFAGAAILANDQDATEVIKNSNLSGFANFAMSDDQSDADITHGGTWTFSTIIPGGYELTTENPSQTTKITAMDQAPGGFVADPPLPFVGIAPILTIETNSENADQFTCTNGSATITADLYTDSKHFSCTVTQGLWHVSWHKDGQLIAERQVQVTNWPVRIPLPTYQQSSTDIAPMVLDFDDLLNSENIRELASGYGGVHWHNAVATHHKYYQGWGYVNGTTSGEIAIYNSSGHPARLYHNAGFDFVGAFISVAWPAGMNAPVRIQALKQGKVIAEDAFYASNLRPVWFDAGFADIDELRFSHDQYWQIVIDDIALIPPTNYE